MAHAVIACIALGALALAGPWRANAQAVIDPTRPPAEFLVPGGHSAADSVPAGGAGQIIILSRDRKAVTVNGRTASLGGRLGEATVTDISDRGVTTRKDKVVDQIRLYGNVDKRLSIPAELAKPQDRTRQVTP